MFQAFKISLETILGQYIGQFFDSKSSMYQYDVHDTFKRAFGGFQVNPCKFFLNEASSPYNTLQVLAINRQVINIKFNCHYTIFYQYLGIVFIMMEFVIHAKMISWMN